MKCQLWIFFAVLISCPAFGQELNIVPYLKDIEAGKVENVKEALPGLISGNPSDPSVQFLEAVLVEDGDAALEKYKSIVRKYPKSRFADAALYRIFSYYFAVGLYTQAAGNLQKLKNNYPNSPYIKLAERKIPKDKPSLAVPIPKPVKTSEASTKRFSIQVGAFMNLNNARNLKDSFTKAGYTTEIKPKTVGASILNVVYVGKFPSADEAGKMLDEVFSKFKIKGRVVEAK